MNNNAKHWQEYASEYLKERLSWCCAVREEFLFFQMEIYKIHVMFDRYWIALFSYINISYEICQINIGKINGLYLILWDQDGLLREF